MIEGIKILATEEIAIAWESFNWHNFWLTAIVSFCVAVVFGFFVSLTEKDFLFGFTVFLTISAIAAPLIGFAIGKNTGEPIEYKTQYQVLIDESVSMTEFYEKYNIIERKGETYIIEEKINE